MATIKGLIEVENQIGKPLIREMILSYSEQAASMLNDLQAGLEAGALEEVRVSAHALKSMSANIGAAKVKSMASAIEVSAKAGDRSKFPPDVSGIRRCVEEFENEARSFGQ